VKLGWKQDSSVQVSLYLPFKRLHTYDNRLPSSSSRGTVLEVTPLDLLRFTAKLLSFAGFSTPTLCV
jgi:hypothetical protein